MSLTLDPMEFTDAGTIELDKRGRGNIVKPSELNPNVKYRKFIGKHGEVVLMPVVEVPAHEAWLFNNPSALASVKRGLQQSARGEGKETDFSEFATEDAE